MRYLVLFVAASLFGMFAYLKYLDVQLNKNGEYYWVVILAAISLALCWYLVDVVRKNRNA
jgi:drug/metabolite transporter superfamily protein YnfA